VSKLSNGGRRIVLFPTRGDRVRSSTGTRPNRERFGAALRRALRPVEGATAPSRPGQGNLAAPADTAHDVGEVSEAAVQCEIRVDLPDVRRDDALLMLAVRPMSWLQPFLRLAANHADRGNAVRDGPRSSSTNHWFRLGPPDAGGRCRFIWHPHGHTHLFTGFVGTVGVDRTQNGCRLELAGWAEGGDEQVNHTALQILADLLATALSGVRPTDS
jgi:hypothetical protein